jgi:putative RNA 2'-phosphotransferase
MTSLVHLSKTMSLILRHKPERFGVQLDSEGWTSLTGLLEALRHQPIFRDVSLVDIDLIQSSIDKVRFEVDMAGDRIRAYYGHSIPQKIERTPVPPPDTLYHGTSPDVLSRILSEGLKPMGRQDVHLSTSLETARKTGARHHPQPVILFVNSSRAHKEGIKFYRGNQDVWLSEPIPSMYIGVA